MNGPIHPAVRNAAAGAGRSRAAWILLGLVCGLLAPALCSLAGAQPVTRPDVYFPLCPGSHWHYDSGDWQEIVGTRMVGGRVGTVARWRDGIEMVYHHAAGQLLLLQLSLDDEDCGLAAITFNTPILLLAAGNTPGTVNNIATTIQVTCAGKQLAGTASGSVTLVAFHGTWTVPAGIFPNVIELRLVVTLKIGSETLPLNAAFWLAEAVGPIRVRDYVENLQDNLVQGAVCGQPVTPMWMAVDEPSGCSWARGTRQTIRWRTGPWPQGDAVRIDLLKGGIHVRTSCPATPNNGAYLWLIDMENEPGWDYSIEVSAVAHPELRAASEIAFAITGTESAADPRLWTLYE